MIRENTLLARAFGATLNGVVQAIGVCAVCGTGTLTIACETTGDILDNSSDRPAHRPAPERQPQAQSRPDRIGLPLS